MVEKPRPVPAAASASKVDSRTTGVLLLYIRFPQEFGEEILSIANL
jgi:hypothetical protein